MSERLQWEELAPQSPGPRLGWGRRQWDPCPHRGSLSLLRWSICVVYTLDYGSLSPVAPGDSRQLPSGGLGVEGGPSCFS